ncbi:hypothetical protein [Legionella fallonii]|uniref:Uncharacterized protein n=1 Tax=Legionella fallonii LLAP-10 TaxID=1212491 RepID=A0A098G2H4_9GAMM|nr:hypothetical protein [Legionella fallonii]CEG56189.1 conserved protein of unknown function [Legionella fallonii LLAP-10]
MPREKQRQLISLNKDKDNLFIAICKKEGHSFVMLGVYDKNNKVKQVLCRVGKLFTSEGGDEDSGCLFFLSKLWQILFGNGAKAQLSDEGVARNKFDPISISYQAYELSYRQYKEFIQLLEGLQTNENQFKVFKPIQEEGSEVTLELTTDLVFSDKVNTDKLKDNTCKLSIDNNCRHSAIQMVEETTHTPLPSLVSTNYMSDLPYKTQLEYGSPSQDIPFYVLPVAPTAYPELSEHKRNILSQLYERMEHMLLIAPNSVQTQRKFQCLKDLYVQMAGPKKDQSLSELLVSIQSWRAENHLVIDELRETNLVDDFLACFTIFKRKSATAQLFDKIEENLEQAQANQIG